MSSPNTVDITIWGGEPFAETYVWKDAGEPVDLTGATAYLNVLPTSGTAPLLSLTTENGGLTLGGSSGTIAVAVSVEQSAALSIVSANYELHVVIGATNYWIMRGLLYRRTTEYVTGVVYSSGSTGVGLVCDLDFGTFASPTPDVLIDFGGFV